MGRVLSPPALIIFIQSKADRGAGEKRTSYIAPVKLETKATN